MVGGEEETKLALGDVGKGEEDTSEKGVQGTGKLGEEEVHQAEGGVDLAVAPTSQ